MLAHDEAAAIAVAGEWTGSVHVVGEFYEAVFARSIAIKKCAR